MIDHDHREQPWLVAVVGPTACGKSVVAAQLARRIGGEIISFDAMQVYRGLSICTAAPSADVRALAPHHGLQMLEPSQEWSVARFVAFARDIVAQIARRGATPVLVGGSGLYLRALLDGLCPAPGADWTIRRRLLKEAADAPERLHARLADVDPTAASRIEPRNVRRVIRALEVYEQSGRPLSSLQRQTVGLRADHRIVTVGLTAPRAVLYRWIEARVEAMLRDGLVEEIRRLLQQPVSRTAAAVLGVPEISGYLRGERSLEEATRLLQRNSRRYAKRQLTWFHADPTIRWIERNPAQTTEAVVDRIMAWLPAASPARVGAS